MSCFQLTQIVNSYARSKTVTNEEILTNGPEGWTHVSTSMIDVPPTWLRYEVAGVYSVWMDDNGTNPNPYWREMPNNCIEFPEFIRSRNDIEQLKESNERVKKLEQINLELAANVEACCELTEMDMGAAIDRLFEIDNTESKALLNKFAIEKKIESINEAIDYHEELKASGEPIGAGTILHVCLGRLVSQKEQLRKEQSSD